MAHFYRFKAAWLTYLGIQAIWALLVVLTPFAASAYPSKLWALPFCVITFLGGAHLIYFRYEYNAVLRKALRFFPYARYLTPPQNDYRYFLPLGVLYASAAVVSTVLVILA